MQTIVFYSAHKYNETKYVTIVNSQLNTGKVVKQNHQTD